CSRRVSTFSSFSQLPLLTSLVFDSCSLSKNRGTSRSYASTCAIRRVGAVILSPHEFAVPTAVTCVGNKKSGTAMRSSRFMVLITRGDQTNRLGGAAINKLTCWFLE